MAQLSPDGRWRWDGGRWVPASAMAAPAASGPRVPTKWTRKLQILLLVVAGLGLLVELLTLILVPAEVAGVRDTVSYGALGGGESATLTGISNAVVAGVIVFLILFDVAYLALQVVGTLRRWVWWYWVQLAIFCVTALGLVLTPLDRMSPLASAPPAPTLVGVVFDLVSVAAGVCMLLAAIRIGPWAMARQAIPRG